VSALYAVNAPLLKIIAGHSYHWPIMAGIHPESWKAAREQVERIGLGTRIPIAEQYRNEKAFKPEQVTNAIAWEILQTIIKIRDEVQQYDRNTLKHGRMNGEPVPEWVCLCRDLPEFSTDADTVKEYQAVAKKHISWMNSVRVASEDNDAGYNTLFDSLVRTNSPKSFRDKQEKRAERNVVKNIYEDRTHKSQKRKNLKPLIRSAFVTIAKNR